MTQYLVTRDVSVDECHWLSNVPVPIKKDMIVYKCVKITYGCVREFPATFDPEGGYPFFELPFNAIESM